MAKGGHDVRLAWARNPGGYTEMLQALGFESLLSLSRDPQRLR